MLRRTDQVDLHSSANRRPSRVFPRQLLAAVSFSTLVISLSAYTQAAEYVVTDLGTLGGYLSDSIAEDVNATGHVVGQTSAKSGYRALYYDGNLRALPISGSTSHALAINAGGQIVGYHNDDAANNMAFRYDGTVHDLGTLGGKWSIASGINDRGLIVGYSTISAASTSPTHAFSLRWHSPRPWHTRRR